MSLQGKVIESRISRGLGGVSDAIPERTQFTNLERSSVHAIIYRHEPSRRFTEYKSCHIVRKLTVASTRQVPYINVAKSERKSNFDRFSGIRLASNNDSMPKLRINEDLLLPGCGVANSSPTIPDFNTYAQVATLLRVLLTFESSLHVKRA
jgi:hypothetical protein